MGRKPLVATEAIFAAVGAEVLETGKFRLERLIEATGLSTGSIYHRFPSREALLARTWLHALTGFHTVFLAALASREADATDQAALATPRFCRAEPALARVLACCRKEEFVGPETPPAIARAIADANATLAAQLARFARRIGRPLLACRLALAAYPLAAVRLYLPHRPVPVSLDAEILKAARAALL